MYRISQFKPALYVLLLVGILGFALASESAGIWVLGTGGVLLNAWLVKTGRFIPMPRLLANVVTIAAMLFIAREVFVPNTTPVMIIGKFLVLLQLIKLWEQRANRDYAQLLVLSLLLMVAAAINTASLLFGVLFVIYLFLSLYCCLLFHLKVESDSARAAFAVSDDRLSPATLRQDERYLSRSMRRLTGLVSGVAIVLAVVVFVLFPRGAGAGMFGPLQFRQSQTLTGFSDSVSFQQLAKITQSNEEVAYVFLSKDGEPVRGTETLLLRGVTLDLYNDQMPVRGSRWQWLRSPNRFESQVQAIRDEPTGLSEPAAGARNDRYVQHVTLKPTGTRTIFALGGATSMTMRRRDLRIRFNAQDGVLQADEPLNVPIEYEVVSTGTLPADVSDLRPASQPGEGRRPLYERINPRIREYVSNADVSGRADNGDALAALRPPAEHVTPLDGEIARNVEAHLRTQFTYTLDLTDAAKLRRDDDPMVAFLYDLKRGHCEYFAGAMTLMCQSLGLKARLVNGFKCDEFNDLGGYYLVRQSHAHSWVEVLTNEGWQTFDPTSSREEGPSEAGLWQSVKHFFDFLEFTYANSVIAYDNDHRENLIQNVESKMTNSAYEGTEWFRGLRAWFERHMYDVSSTAIGAVMTLMILAMVAFVVWFLWERWMLRRRARRIGLENLSASDQIRLVRQLGFFDDLMRLLARHHITRPKHLTPMEFSQTLLYLPSQAYDTIRRLTGVFYRVRYGNQELSPTLQRRLDTVITRLDEALGPPPR